MNTLLTHNVPKGMHAHGFLSLRVGKMNVETTSSVIHMCAVFTKQPEGKLD